MVGDGQPRSYDERITIETAVRSAGFHSLDTEPFDQAREHLGCLLVSQVGQPSRDRAKTRVVAWGAAFHRDLLEQRMWRCCLSQQTPNTARLGRR
jgi:hypothetical protein